MLSVKWKKTQLECQLTAWCRVLPEKLTVPQLLKIFPATCPYSEPGNFNIFLPSTTGSSKQSHSLGSPPPKFCIHLSPICETCPAHLILLDLITQITFVEEYTSYSSSLCSLHLSPINLSLLGPHILLCTLPQTPSACVPPSIWATTFHTCTKQEAKL